MATIPHVTPDTVIEAAAQNAFIDEVNSVCAKRTGSTITGTDIYSNSDPAFKLRRTGNTPQIYFEQTDGTRMGYIQCTTTGISLIHDAATGVINLTINGTVVAQAQADGDFWITGGQLTVDGGIQGDNLSTRTITADGTLTINPATGDLCARFQGTLPFLEWKNEANTARYGYLQGQSAGMTLFSDNAVIFAADGVEQMRLTNQVLLLGKNVSNLNTEGIEIHASSAAEGSIRTTTNVSSVQNLYAVHQAAADANDQLFCQFVRGTGRAEIGSITQNGTSGVKYNTTSDYRLKNDLGPIVDAVDRLATLTPRRITWKTDPAAGEQDGFFAHEVTAAVPEAVTGAKDAVAPAPPLDGEGNPDPAAPPQGQIVPQQLDTSRLVPLLVAAVQELAARVAQLEGTPA